MGITSAIQVARLTDVGKVRARNEDAVASDLRIGLIMLADGMGGYKSGEVASDIALLTVAAELSESLQHQEAIAKRYKLQNKVECLESAVGKANHYIFDISQKIEDCEGMGTTLVTGLFTNNKIVVGHVGDSRMYRLRGKQLTRLTKDHSFLQEQINAGEITEKEAKQSNSSHLVTRALGTDNKVDLEVNVFNTLVGDLYMLCSDGLTDLVADEEIRVILLEQESDIDLAAKSLINFANKQGGRDNVSIVIARVKTTFLE